LIDLHGPWPNRLKHLEGLSDAEKSELSELLADWDPDAHADEVHWRLAQWYHRIALAAQAPHAIFEAIYHVCKSAYYSQARTPQADNTLQQAGERVQWASTIVTMHGFLVQTAGYSRGSCRRLDFIQDKVIKKIVKADEAPATSRSGTAS
jgi:hypothetical protein